MKIEKIEKEAIINALRDSGKFCWGFCKFKDLTLDENTEAFYIPEKNCYYAVYTNKMPENRMFGKKMLLYYISHDEKCHIPAEELNKLDCIQMPAEAFDTVKDKLAGFNAGGGYKLYYDYSHVPAADTGRYSVVEFDFSNEQHYIAASNMLNQEEDEDWMMPDNIRKIASEYKRYAAFNPELWIFAKANAEDKLIGVAISYFDEEVGQTDIDWVYVLPEFHGKGVGLFLMNETVKRCKERSKDIRAVGDDFYKKCGFIEKECTVYATKENFEFIHPSQPNILL